MEIEFLAKAWKKRLRFPLSNRDEEINSALHRVEHFYLPTTSSILPSLYESFIIEEHFYHTTP